MIRVKNSNSYHFWDEVPLRPIHYGTKVATLWYQGSDTMGPMFRHYGVPTLWVQGSDTMGPRFRHYGTMVPTLWDQGSDTMDQGSDTTRFRHYGTKFHTIRPRFRHSRTNVPTLWDQGSNTLGPRFRHYVARFPILSDFLVVSKWYEF